MSLIPALLGVKINVDQDSHDIKDMIINNNIIVATMVYSCHMESVDSDYLKFREITVGLKY